MERKYGGLLKGHEYQQSVLQKTNIGQGCPICANQKILAGYNDLATTHPEIAKEWRPTKNGSLRPSDVTLGSGKMVWWKCPIGHEYQASIHDRGSGQTNCPICNSSRLTSFGGQSIYYYIRKIYPDTLNRYNEFFSNSMEFDVYVPSLKIAIEYDGGHWHQTEDGHNREIKKYNFCKENNITLIRVKEQNTQNWNDVADRIYYIPKTKRNDFSKLEQAISSIIENMNSTTKIDINISRDKLEIQNYLYKIDNSLADEDQMLPKNGIMKKMEIYYQVCFQLVLTKLYDGNALIVDMSGKLVLVT